MKLLIDIPERILDTIQADEMISREQLSILQMHILKGTPLDEKEPTYEEVIEYCKKRHLALVTYSFMHRLLNGGDK